MVITGLAVWFFFGIFVFGFLLERTCWDALLVITFSILWPFLLPITLVGMAGSWFAKKIS